MLGQVITLLGPELGRSLQQALLPGVGATDALPLAAGSVLSKGVTGTTNLVQRLGIVSSHGLDPLDEARNCLEYGQVDKAQCLLEAATLQAPEREALHRELLDIYRHTRDSDALVAMRRHIGALSVPVEDAWRETKRYLQACMNLNSSVR
jgi:hypothetical protein